MKHRILIHVLKQEWIFIHGSQKMVLKPVASASSQNVGIANFQAPP